MSPFDAYRTYLALKNHFEKDGYDYFKYNGKMPVKIESFYARKDKYFFEKLARKDDLVNFLVANFLEKEKSWSRELTHEEADRIYKDWIKRTQSLTYKFKEEIELVDDLKEAIAVKDGQHPLLLKLYLQKKISPESLIIVDSLAGMIKMWDDKIEDTIIWPLVRRKLTKYRPFLKFEKKKFGEMLLQKYRK